MLRELQVINGKNVDAMYKTDVALVTGMAVKKNFTDKTVDMPTAATVDGFFFVNKQRIPTGLNCARGDMSDYDVNFTNVEIGEFVDLVTPMIGERYATDQFIATGLVDGVALMVGVDGKFAKATAPSRFIYGGTFNDAGNTLAIVEVSATTVTNA